MSVLAPQQLSLWPLTAPVYRLSVAQYHDMIRKGVLRSGDPIELLEGVLVVKMTKGLPHRFATQTLRDQPYAMLPSGWFVDDQEPVTTTDSEPEPDLMIARGDRRQYLLEDRHPGPAETALASEVSDTSLGTDQGTKARVDARASVPECWIVNVVDRRVQVYTDPNGPADQPSYQQSRNFAPGEEVPVALDGQEIGRVPVSDLFP